MLSEAQQTCANVSLECLHLTPYRPSVHADCCLSWRKYECRRKHKNYFRRKNIFWTSEFIRQNLSQIQIQKEKPQMFYVTVAFSRQKWLPYSSTRVKKKNVQISKPLYQEKKNKSGTMNVTW